MGRALLTRGRRHGSKELRVLRKEIRQSCVVQRVGVAIGDASGQGLVGEHAAAGCWPELAQLASGRGGEGREVGEGERRMKKKERKREKYLGFFGTRI